MALPASGAISFANVNVELNKASTATIGLNCADVRTLFGKASGAISMNDGYGKSNLITGCATFANVGSYTWTVPASVQTISSVVVGGGGGFNLGGGGLSYKNDASVTTSQTHFVFVGAGSASQRCYAEAGQASFILKANINTNYNSINQSIVRAPGGYAQLQFVGDGGGQGGQGAAAGAAGYGCVGQFSTAKGGKGGTEQQSGAAGVQGAGGGGGGVYIGPEVYEGCEYIYQPYQCNGAGGGVGLKGRGSNGTAGSPGGGGGGGSGGQAGASGSTTVNYSGATAGKHGGGGARNYGYNGGSNGAGGGVRIVYPGATRKFPTTCVS